MWLFTPQGFISAVENRDNPETIMIRAQDPDHLRAMFPSETITETTGSDYPARIFMDRYKFAAWLTVQAVDIDYDNFKGAIPHDATIYHDACFGVWEQMQTLDPRRQG